MVSRKFLSNHSSHSQLRSNMPKAKKLKPRFDVFGQLHGEAVIYMGLSYATKLVAEKVLACIINLLFGIRIRNLLCTAKREFAL